MGLIALLTPAYCPSPRHALRPVSTQWDAGQGGWGKVSILAHTQDLSSHPTVVVTTYRAPGTMLGG